MALTAGVGHPVAMAATPTFVHCRMSKYAKYGFDLKLWNKTVWYSAK